MRGVCVSEINRLQGSLTRPNTHTHTHTPAQRDEISTEMSVFIHSIITALFRPRACAFLMPLRGHASVMDDHRGMTAAKFFCFKSVAMMVQRHIAI